MAWRVSEIRLPPDRESDLLQQALRMSGLRKEDVLEWHLVRRSLDRRRGQLSFLYTVDLVTGTDRKGRPPLRSVVWVEPEIWEPPSGVGESVLAAPPVIIGTGPAGLFAGLLLAQRGFCPVLLERGDKMNERARRIREINEEALLDPESNYLFGEGGAGTYSDGKLTTRSKDPRAAYVLKAFEERSGVSRVMWDYRPHLGSDRVRAVVGRVRQEILELGGRFQFRTCAQRVRPRADGYTVETSRGEVHAGVVVAAPGHSARDLLRQLARDGIPMSAKAFQLGLRVEHPQEWVDQRVLGSYKSLPALCPADYRLLVDVPRGREVFSFCMCPGGEIIPATQDAGLVNTNGMSWSRRSTGFANSGLVATLRPEDLPTEEIFAGMDLQESLERQAHNRVGGLRIPGQRLMDFLESRPSSEVGPTSSRVPVVPADLTACLPVGWPGLFREALRRMDRQMPGFLHASAVLVGPEARSSSPVRLERDPESLAARGFPGFYPVGEGAGYAGGIISAAVDGLRAAERIVTQYRPSSMRPTGSAVET